MPILLESQQVDGACIKVIGIGGGGGNAVNNMITRGLKGVEFIAANTDKQALEHNKAHIKIQVGKQTTRGLGAGAHPEVGKLSIEENREEIIEALKGSDMVFITSGMGGGTGTGGAPIVASIAQEQGALVVAIVTKPFDWEGKKRKNIADEWIQELRKNVDALIVIPNQKLLEIIDKNTSFKDAFQKVDEVLYNATKGMSDIISCHGIVNVDFADVQTVMKGMGDALMGIGIANGDNRASEATRKALNSPLLDGVSINGAKGLLVNITGGPSMTMHEISEAVSLVEQAAGGEANLIHGVVHNDDMKDDLMVTVVATGFNKSSDEVAYTREAVEEKVPEDNRNVRNTNIANFIAQRNRENSYAPIPEAASSNIGGPRGTNQLQKYDSPAYARRLSANDFSDKAINASPSTSEKLAKAALKNNTDQPAFLRKMMD